jgi:hypothetical protein
MVGCELPSGGKRKWTFMKVFSPAIVLYFMINNQETLSSVAISNTHKGLPTLYVFVTHWIKLVLKNLLEHCK